MIEGDGRGKLNGRKESEEEGRKGGEGRREEEEA